MPATDSSPSYIHSPVGLFPSPFGRATKVSHVAKVTACNYCFSEPGEDFFHSSLTLFNSLLTFFWLLYCASYFICRSNLSFGS